ncbi:MAG: hypothetical protein GY943_10540 [Chloroflexi bacterium]|nr:hypothetical protein [Chloroflexota bacterium]
MTKRKSQLAGKLGGKADPKPGWRDTIRLNQPQEQSVEEPTPARTTHPVRRNKPKRKTYLLTPDLIERIEILADEERVGINELVRFLLSTSIELIETGQIEIPTAPGRRRISR